MSLIIEPPKIYSLMRSAYEMSVEGPTSTKDMTKIISYKYMQIYKLVL